MTFKTVASKLQDELADIISNKKEANEYELIVYKYVFISELEIPLLDDMDLEITEDSFILHIIPDDLEFDCLRILDDAFDKYKLSFMPNSYGVIKIKFSLIG